MTDKRSNRRWRGVRRVEEPSRSFFVFGVHPIRRWDTTSFPRFQSVYIQLLARSWAENVDCKKLESNPSLRVACSWSFLRRNGTEL